MFKRETHTPNLLRLEHFLKNIVKAAYAISGDGPSQIRDVNYEASGKYEGVFVKGSAQFCGDGPSHVIYGLISLEAN